MMDEVRLFQLLMVKVVDHHIQKKNVENLFMFDKIPQKLKKQSNIYCKALFFFARHQQIY